VTLAAPAVWSFTSFDYGCPCTVFAPTATPAVSAASDAAAVELGMKFRADTNGFVTGVRFYKGTTNTGTHVGSLWTTSGTLLAQVTFTGETASGWQQALFSSPVAVTAGTTYVISYHTNVGRYSYTSNGLSANVDRGPLHAPSSATSGGNGVYSYGATPRFPNLTFNATNYWVDVIFATS
jgi:hypothetical protein